MMARPWFLPVLGLSLVGSVFWSACSPSASEPSNDASASGGSPAETGTGGKTGGSGGTTATGGGTGSGGRPGSGGQPGSGGAPGDGTGGQATGGSSGAAGTPGSGGGDATAGRGGGGGGRSGGGGRPGAGGGAVAGSTGGGGRALTGGTGGQTPGSGGAGGASSTASKPSAGCGMATSQAANQWVSSDVMSGTTTRKTSVRLPTGYDPMRAYPVIVLLHGCGGGTNNVPMENATGSSAILVRGTGSASGTCWDTAANGPDVAFFDAMVADVKARFCTDENRVFVVGYSSGSWLVNQLTCIRSTVLRGGATVTGGESATGTCKGPVSRIFIHDSDDTDNAISGSIKARDRQLTQNGCDKTMQPVPIDPSPCVTYPGCPTAYPVEFCQTSGQKHNRQDSWAPSAFWNFFKQF